MSTMNLKEIRISSFLNHIKTACEMAMAGGEWSQPRPILGLGKPGIGKSEGIEGLAKQLGIGYCELRLVTMQETDVIGVPLIEKDAGGNPFTTWASNGLLPTEAKDGKYGILVLDEITSCSKSLRTCCFQLLDGKRAIANYKLPDGWVVVAIGNGDEDGGSFEGLEPAFLNRFQGYRVTTTFDDWHKWAVDNNVNPSILAFLTQFKTEFYTFNSDTGDIAEAFASPRTWTSFSKLLSWYESRNGGKAIEVESVSDYASGFVGERTGSLFADFYRFNTNKISVEDILAGKVKAEVVKSLDHKEFLIIMRQIESKVAAIFKEEVAKTFEVTDREVQTVINIASFVFSSGSMDNQVLMIRSLSQSIDGFQSVFEDERFRNTAVGQHLYKNVLPSASKALRGNC